MSGMCIWGQNGEAEQIGCFGSSQLFSQLSCIIKLRQTAILTAAAVSSSPCAGSDGSDSFPAGNRRG